MHGWLVRVFWRFCFSVLDGQGFGMGWRGMGSGYLVMVLGDYGPAYAILCTREDVHCGATQHLRVGEYTHIHTHAWRYLVDKINHIQRDFYSLLSHHMSYYLVLIKMCLSHVSLPIGVDLRRNPRFGSLIGVPRCLSPASYLDSCIPAF